MSLPLRWLPKQNKKIKSFAHVHWYWYAKLVFVYARTHRLRALCCPLSLSVALLQNKAHVAAYQPSQPVFSASLTLSQLLLLLFVVVRLFFVLCVPRCSLALSQLLLLRFVVGFVPLTCLLVFVLARFVLCFCKTRTLLCYCCRWCQIHTYEHTCTHTHTDVVAMCEVYVNMRWWNTGQMANVQCVNWNWKREIKNCRKLYNKATKNKF